MPRTAIWRAGEEGWWGFEAAGWRFFEHEFGDELAVETGIERMP
jgi:hypothetical protein